MICLKHSDFAFRICFVFRDSYFGFQSSDFGIRVSDLFHLFLRKALVIWGALLFIHNGPRPMSSVRQLVQQEPVDPQFLYGLFKLLKFHGLHNVTVHPQFITAH